MTDLRLTCNQGVCIVWQGADVRLVLPVAELPEWQALFRAAPAPVAPAPATEEEANV